MQKCMVFAFYKRKILGDKCPYTTAGRCVFASLQRDRPQLAAVGTLMMTMSLAGQLMMTMIPSGRQPLPYVGLHLGKLLHSQTHTPHRPWEPSEAAAAAAGPCQHCWCSNEETFCWCRKWHPSCPCRSRRSRQILRCLTSRHRQEQGHQRPWGESLASRSRRAHLELYVCGGV